MLTTDILDRKRHAAELSRAEIECLIQRFVKDQVSNEQMAAFAMAVCIQGMTPRETADLTMAMLHSGECLPRVRSTTSGSAKGEDPVERFRVDKHSTGGLGDKVSLVLAPLLAACDVQVPMISGRGLGLTGGTLDKLESIPGFRTDLDGHQRQRVLDEVGTFIVGADQSIAPADRRLYAIRDVTATVASVPLITASILSKKLAASLDGLVMDVKVGSAAFMKDLASARVLAKSLIETGRHAGLRVTALITDMDQPLGKAVGNAIEVNEAIEILSGASGPVRDLTLALAAEAILINGENQDESPRGESFQRAFEKVTSILDRGDAYEKFFAMVHHQGGEISTPLPIHPARVIESPSDGFVESLDCETLGNAIVHCGGGRQKMTDKIDPAVGLDIHVRIGRRVCKGQPLISWHATGPRADECYEKLKATIEITDQAVEPRELILERCC